MQSLFDLNPGQQGTVGILHVKGSMRRRLLDIGLIADTPVCCLGRSPGGGMRAYLIRGAVIALRDEDCKTIEIQK